MVQDTTVDGAGFAVLLEDPDRIGPADVAYLAGEVFPEGLRQPAEATALCAMHRTVPDQCQEWTTFLTASLSRYLVHVAEPVGLVTADKASWLLAELGGTAMPAALEIVVAVLDRAESAPESLARHALSLVRMAMEGGDLAPEAGVEMVRRVLHAAGRRTAEPFSRGEAELLGELDDWLGGLPGPSPWRELKANGLLSHLADAAAGVRIPRTYALSVGAPLDAPAAALSAAGMSEGFIAALELGLAELAHAEPPRLGDDDRDALRWLMDQIIEQALLEPADEASLAALLSRGDGGIWQSPAGSIESRVA